VTDDLFDLFELQIWTADVDGQLDFVNAFTADYLGVSRERLIGDGWQNVVHSADLPTAGERWMAAVRTGEPYVVDFRLLRAADRAYRWHRASARRTSTAEGLRWFGSNIDIDAARRAEEVVTAQRELEGDLPEDEPAG
jgi:PAS domain S-box-containing protein